MSWTAFPPQSFTRILNSGRTYELTRPDWPAWTARAPQVRRIFAYALGPGETVPSTGTTSVHVVRLLTERYDPSDSAPWNYNWYWVVQSTDGALYQSPPSRDVDFGHHLRNPISDLSVGLR